MVVAGDVRKDSGAECAAAVRFSVKPERWRARALALELGRDPDEHVQQDVAGGSTI